MTDQSKKRLRRATITYWVLLIYIIAALVWWLLSLEQQNQRIYELRKETLLKTLSANAPEIKGLEQEKKADTIKYVSEGITFLLLILIGAAYIYRLVRKQFLLQQQQQNFVMAVTHELKTPIAVSRLNLETLQKHQLDESKRSRLLQMTLRETMRLDTLINNILIAAQLDDNAYNSTKEELNFSALAMDVAQQFGSRYPDRKLGTRIEPDAELVADALLLKLLLSNLLENANKYSPKEKPIRLNVFDSNGEVQIEVVDEGQGIDEKEKENIFKKFYRIGDEQTRKTKGTGLGLYLCKKIAEDHNGRISVADNQPTGSIFIVRFKK
jgi:two-component system, OmpR family, sensor histidine kinase CiaH